jgi:hypothetical protein
LNNKAALVSDLLETIEVITFASLLKHSHCLYSSKQQKNYFCSKKFFSSTQKRISISTKKREKVIRKLQRKCPFHPSGKGERIQIKEKKFEN